MGGDYALMTSLHANAYHSSCRRRCRTHLHLEPSCIQLRHEPHIRGVGLVGTRSLGRPFAAPGADLRLSTHKEAAFDTLISIGHRNSQTSSGVQLSIRRKQAPAMLGWPPY